MKRCLHITPTNPLPRRRRGKRLRIARWVLMLSMAAIAAPGCGTGTGTQMCSPRDDSDSCFAHQATATACQAADGCSAGPTCIQVECPALAMSACTASPSCTWLGGTCYYATNNPCAMLAEEACAAQQGCTWADVCVGQLKSCAGLSEAACNAIPHCFMETVPSF
jgi:hypothetical protein